MNEYPPLRLPVERHVANTYGVATANILDLATIFQGRSWHVQHHVNAAYRAGYDGVELWPQKVYPQLHIMLNNLWPSEKAGILSVHQSARLGLRRIHSLRSLPSGNSVALREIEKIPFLPETVDSLVEVGYLSHQVGDVPAVFLMEERPNMNVGNDMWLNFSQRGVQPNPELCQLWGCATPQEFVVAMNKRGLTNTVIDTHHLRRPHIKTGQPNPLGDWRKTIPQLLPHTREIHVGIGRSDKGEMGKAKVRAEAMDMISGGVHNTELVQMLRLIADQKWKGLVIVEMRPSIYKGKKLFLSTKDLVTIYGRVRNTLRTIFDN